MCQALSKQLSSPTETLLCPSCWSLESNVYEHGFRTTDCQHLLMVIKNCKVDRWLIHYGTRLCISFSCHGSLSKRSYCAKLGLFSVRAFPTVEPQTDGWLRRLFDDHLMTSIPVTVPTTQVVFFLSSSILFFGLFLWSLFLIQAEELPGKKTETSNREVGGGGEGAMAETDGRWDMCLSKKKKRMPVVSVTQ